MRKQTILLMAGVLFSAWTASGLGQDSVGPDPNTVNQAGWAEGVVDLARHPARVYSRWVNGNEAFYFKADSQGINQLLRLFAECKMRDYEVRIRPGAEMVSSFDKKEFEYNVSLEVLTGIARFFRQKSDGAETHEPVLTVYVGEGPHTLEQLKFPENLLLQCEVPGARIKQGAKPVRKRWHGSLQWTQGGPAADMEHGLTTRITLWNEASPDGIEVATGDRDGFFSVPFSDKEMIALRSGEIWLTAKAGNYLSVASKQDAKIPADSLAEEKEKAKPIRISPPTYYFGRLLFEDGSPAVLSEPPWPGAEIRVDFPYAGSAKPDEAGYFKVALEPDQFTKLKEQKDRKNIYIPLKEDGRSQADAVFPAGLLSPDKQKAGIVKIPKS